MPVCQLFPIGIDLSQIIFYEQGCRISRIPKCNMIIQVVSGLLDIRLYVRNIIS